MRPLFPDEIEEKHPILDFDEKNYYLGVMLDTMKDNKMVKALFVKSPNGLKHIAEMPSKFKFKRVPEFSLRISKELLMTDEDYGPDILVQAFGKIKDMLTKYIDFSEPETYDFLSIWILGTYFHPLFYSYPYIHIHGLSNTGKTRTMEVSCLLSFNGVASGNMSESTLFRVIELWRPTLHIDETDVLANKANKPVFAELLLNGNKKFGKAWRSIKKTALSLDYEPKQYEVYCPKMLANIDGLDEILASRAIKVTMWRSKSDKFTREIVNSPDWQEARDLCYKSLFNCFHLVRAAYENLPQESDIINRNWELWKPLLAIASLLPKEIYEELLKYAKKRMKEIIDLAMVEAPEYKLMKALHRLVKQDDWFNLKDIKNLLMNEFEDGEGSWISSHWTGKAMNRLGFKMVRDYMGYKQYFIERKFVDELLERLDIKKDEIKDLENRRITGLNEKIMEFISNKNSVTYEELNNYFGAMGIPELELERRLGNLKRDGMIFEPNVGKYNKC